MSSPRWRRYLRFWKHDLAADIDDELRFHLELRASQYASAGMSPDEARDAANAQFGDMPAVRSELVAINRRVARRRDVVIWLDSLRADFRTTVRSLARQPGFAAAVLLTLALGLGINAAMFSLLDRVYFRMPAGVADPEHLRRLWTPTLDKRGRPAASELRVSVETYARLASAFDTLAGSALFARQPSIRLDDDPDELRRRSFAHRPSTCRCSEFDRPSVGYSRETKHNWILRRVWR